MSKKTVDTEQAYKYFIRWMALPPTSRQPTSISELAENLGVTERTISQFTLRDSYPNDLFVASMEWGRTKVPELLHTAYEKYKKTKSANDLKMYREILALDKGSKDRSDDKGILTELFEASRKK
jgi:predicted transcriptional regulator